MKNVLFVVVALLFGFAPNAWSQVTLVESTFTGSMSAAPCTNIILGSELDFIRGTGCDADVIITDINNNLLERFENASFKHTFDTKGKMFFFCGAPKTPPFSGSAAEFSICYNAQPAQAIPTMGEWGLIALSLILMIFSVQAILQKNESPSIELK